MVFRLHASPSQTSSDPHAASTYSALLQAIAAYLHVKGWDAVWNSGEEGGANQRIVVSTSDMDGLFAQVRELPFIEDIEFHGFDVELMVKQIPAPTVETSTLDGQAVTNRRFSMPMPSETIIQALALARAGFAVIGFAVLEEGMLALMRGAPTRELLVRLRDEYSKLQTMLEGSTIDTDTYTDIPDGESISFPGGIPVAALEAALDCIMMSFAVYGFAVTGTGIEPISTYAINPDALGDTIASLS